MNYATAKTNFWDWLNFVVNSPSGTMPIIWANENGPRPTDALYLGVNVIAGPTKKGSAWKSKISGVASPSDTGTQSVVQEWELSISVQAYGDGGDALLSAVAIALELESTYAVLKSKGLFTRGEPTIKDVSEIIDETAEKRAVLDLTLGYTEKVTDSPGWIGDVALSDNYTHAS